MPSSEFRRRYAGLTEPTTVTVLGRTIGIWLPGSALSEIEQMRREPFDIGPVPFRTRPFTPVPKKGR